MYDNLGWYKKWCGPPQSGTTGDGVNERQAFKRKFGLIVGKIIICSKKKVSIRGMDRFTFIHKRKVK